jgi:N-terminal domain on NACHT_NTPase and P-loop NTPases
MTDPVGTTLAAISLGITVCDGIFKYCQAWKSQNDQVQSLKDLTQILRVVLEEAEVRLRNCPAVEGSISDSLNTCIQRCQTNIDAILQMSEKYAPPLSTDSWSDTTKRHIRKLMFPFKRETLLELHRTLKTFQANFDTILEYLSM